MADVDPKDLTTEEKDAKAKQFEPFADVLNPFGDQGPNPYSYDQGDPRNKMDPSGH